MVTKKNILIISPFFFPEPISTGKFNTDIAIALKEQGYHVSVLCSHPLYPKWVPEKSNARLDGINIIRGGSWVRYSKSPFIRRAILEIWFTLFLLFKYPKYARGIDVIIPVFPPSLGFFILLPLIKSRILKVGMVHDLQEVYSQEKKGIINKWISSAINYVERKTFKACNRLIFLSEEMKQTAKQLYDLSEEKLYVQYPFANITPGKITNDLSKILPDHAKHVVYSGALGEKQNPDEVYAFFDFASKKTENVQFHFFSQGLNFEKLKQNNTNNKIHFSDLVPRENVEELYFRSSVQIIPQKPGTSKGSLPSKLPNVLAAGCKMLFITDKDSEIEEIFNRYKLETVVTTWDNAILYNELKRLLADDDTKKRHHTEIAKKLFSLESMTKKIIA